MATSGSASAEDFTHPGLAGYQQHKTDLALAYADHKDRANEFNRMANSELHHSQPGCVHGSVVVNPQGHYLGAKCIHF